MHLVKVHKMIRRMRSEIKWHLVFETTDEVCSLLLLLLFVFIFIVIFIHFIIVIF